MRRNTVAELKELLSLFEAFTKRKLTHEVSELRHYTLFIHSYLEGSLDIRIRSKLLSEKQFSKEDLRNLWTSTQIILNEVDLQEK